MAAAPIRRRSRAYQPTTIVAVRAAKAQRYNSGWYGSRIPPYDGRRRRRTSHSPIAATGARTSGIRAAAVPPSNRGTVTSVRRRATSQRAASATTAKPDSGHISHAG